MPQSQTLNSISITPIKAFTDNYIWAVTSQQNKQLLLVDPGDASVCLSHIKKHQLTLTTILVTHHHPDHIGGIKELAEYCQKHQWPIEIYAPNHPRIPSVTNYVNGGDVIALEEFELSFEVLSLPGHTLDHIAFLSDKTLFCGDTLFSAGCGRLFEGTAQQMFDSLNKLKQLAGDTLVYCTHEYTLANLNFALAVEPNNTGLQDYFHQVTHLRNQNRPSLPSSIALENNINPFLRSHIDDVKQSAVDYAKKPLPQDVDVFATIRQWKDNF